jgi:hypothetical protein
MGKSYVRVTYQVIAVESSRVTDSRVHVFVAQSASEALRLMADWNMNGKWKQPEKSWLYIPQVTQTLKALPDGLKPASLNGICYWEET